ncbi:phage tail tape measure protein, partial [Streptomyces sp. NPDC006967]|uniref:phage tail tape measure protein n=1 Tax=Streptomyces sp. NPDC006967 TaxID=3156906 RepID=UPI0033E99125
MALTVGELNAVLSVDDRAVDPALRRAENAMRQAGQQMGDDAERAGRQAGEELGEGIVRGADGRLRTANGRFVAAGRAAGAAVGDGLADSSAEGADEAVDQAGSRLDRLKMLAAGAGLAAGAILMSSMQEALDQSQITARLGAQLGKTPAVAQQYGKVAGALFKDAIVTDFQSGADTIRAIAAEGLLPPEATNAQIKDIATNAADLASTFDVDVSMAAQAAGIAVKTGLAKNSTEAFDMITKGMSGLGPAGEDLLETIGEYGVQFAKSGLSGRTSFGLMRQAIQAGWKDTDKIADAFKELELRVTGGGKAQVEALQSIGLNADEMIADLSAGGKRGEEAMAKIHDSIVELGPESNVTKKAVQDLFGGPGEDLGAAFFKLNLHTAAKEMGNTAGAADKLGEGLRDNAGARVTQFKNTLQQNLVEFLGGKVIPAMSRAFGWAKEHSGEIKLGAMLITAVVVPALVLMGVTATVAAGRVVWGWITSGAAAVKGAAIHVASATRTAAAWTMMRLRAVGAFLAVAASATGSALRTAAVWAASAARMTATWLVSMLRVAATTVAQFVLMAARAVAWAAVMAAQWLIAMGPVGWVIAAVIGLVALVIANWDTVQKYTGKVWSWITKKVASAVAGVLAAISWLGALPGRVGGYFTSMKNRAVAQAMSLVAWVTGLPGRISRGIGSLSSLLTSKGRNVVQGLWSGISSMGGWIKSKLIGWAKDMIPGPIA